MHHKRKRSQNRRAGCKMCKHWKVNGFPTSAYEGEKFADHKLRKASDHALKQYLSCGGYDAL
jgi:protein-disulfide isomerase-like protein with CxxC motif